VGPDENFKTWLKNMETAGTSRLSIAVRVGVSPKTLTNWSSNGRGPGAAALTQLRELGYVPGSTATARLIPPLVPPAPAPAPEPVAKVKASNPVRQTVTSKAPAKEAPPKKRRHLSDARVAVAVIEGTARIVSAISERNSNLDYLPTVMQKVFDTLVESLAAHS